MREHKGKINKKSFTCKYNCDKLVYYKEYPAAMRAIEREKLIKKRFTRKMKEELIASMNPEWKDLSEGWD
jgi:putative endonuclease